MKKIFISMAVQQGANRIAISIAAIVAVTFLIAYAASLPASGPGTSNGFTTMEDAQITDAGAESGIIAGDVGLKAPSGLSVRQTDSTTGDASAYNLKASGVLLADENAAAAKEPNQVGGRAAMADQVSGKGRLAGIYGFEEPAIAGGNVSPNSVANGNSNSLPSSAATSDLAPRGRSSGGAGATNGASSVGSGGGVAVPSGASAQVVSDATGNSDDTRTFTTIPTPIARADVPADTNGAQIPANDPGAPASGETPSDFLNNAGPDQTTALEVQPTLSTADLALTAADPLAQILVATDNDGSERTVPDVGCTVLLLGVGMAALFYFRNVFFCGSLQLG